MSGEREKKLRGELVDRREDRSYRQALKLLKRYQTAVLKAKETDAGRVFEILKMEFEKDRGEYDRLFEQAGEVLENAFDFMETAFLNSQEMVVFLSDLNTDSYSIRFLQEYECERYDRYNKELLFEDVSTEIRKRIEAL